MKDSLANQTLFRIPQNNLLNRHKFHQFQFKSSNINNLDYQQNPHIDQSKSIKTKHNIEMRIDEFKSTGNQVSQNFMSTQNSYRQLLQKPLMYSFNYQKNNWKTNRSNLEMKNTQKYLLQSTQALQNYNTVQQNNQNQLIKESKSFFKIQGQNYIDIRNINDEKAFQILQQIKDEIKSQWEIFDNQQNIEIPNPINNILRIQLEDFQKQFSFSDDVKFKIDQEIEQNNKTWESQIFEEFQQQSQAQNFQSLKQIISHYKKYMDKMIDDNPFVENLFNSKISQQIIQQAKSDIQKELINLKISKIMIVTNIINEFIPKIFLKQIQLNQIYKDANLNDLSYFKDQDLDIEKSKDQQKQKQDQNELNEIYFSQCFTGKEELIRVQLEILLNSAPQIWNTKSINQWKILGPLDLFDIFQNCDFKIDFDNSQYVSLTDGQNNFYQGQIKDLKNQQSMCIGRILFENGEFYEGVFKIEPYDFKDKADVINYQIENFGYGRYFNNDGTVYVSQKYQNKVSRKFLMYQYFKEKSNEQK